MEEYKGKFQAGGGGTAGRLAPGEWPGAQFFSPPRGRVTDRRGIDLSRPAPVAAQPRSDGRIHHAIRPAVQNVFQVLLRQDARWVARLPVDGVRSGVRPDRGARWGGIRRRHQRRGRPMPGCRGEAGCRGGDFGMSPAEVVFEGPEVLRGAIGGGHEQDGGRVQERAPPSRVCMQADAADERARRCAQGRSDQGCGAVRWSF